MVSVTHTPVNDLDYSAAEYGHVDGVPSPYTFSIPDGPLTDEQAMRLALDAAQCGIRGVNPLVGAVITGTDGRVLYVGWHRGAGTPHAEADALAQARAAGTDLRGASMYALSRATTPGVPGPAHTRLWPQGCGVCATLTPILPPPPGERRICAVTVWMRS